MISKYHNQKVQTNLWHREEEPYIQQSNKTKQPNLSSPSIVSKTRRMDTKERTASHRTTTEPRNERNNQQRININRTSALEQTAS